MARYGSCRSTPPSASAPGRRAPTRSEHATLVARRLRDRRGRLVADETLAGADFGRALADALDRVLADLASSLELSREWALLALGSLARRELCPGSDVDVLLVHNGDEDVAGAVKTLWYPLWDAGIVLGHSVRTPKEALALAESDRDTLTALLDPRTIAGHPSVVEDLVDRARQVARRRRKALIAELAAAAKTREDHPGPIAEMLEPNLKDGSGGLRDLEALVWAGWTLDEPGGLDALVAAGHLQPDDVDVLHAARRHLLEVRVALHRVAEGRGDVLTLQDQDAVAARLGAPDADALVRDLGAAARSVAWRGSDVWRRLRGAPSGRGRSRRRRAARRGPVVPGVVVQADAVALDPSTVGAAGDTVDARTALRLGVVAARTGLPIVRESLEQLRGLAPPRWDDETRASFIELLACGSAAVGVLEAFDQVGLLVALIPEWAHVQARPQRNAYHRFTVDRHLLEAVAECATLTGTAGFDGDVARRARIDLLLLGALLHDVGKGMPGDHSEVGAEVARHIVEHLGLDPHGQEVVGWLVRHHLLLADTATRRDLSDEATILRFARAVRDTERLDLLYALTVGDSRATGPAAWSRAKAALVRGLFVAADTVLTEGVVGPGHDAERRELLARHAELIAGGRLAVAWRDDVDGLLECTVAAPDRPGLLAAVAGVLALHGFDVQRAFALGAEPGMALEIFRGLDRFERFDATTRDLVARQIAEALAGTFEVRGRLAERLHRYRRGVGHAGSARVRVDLEASSAATVVEIEGPDEVGLLARAAAVFADLGLDVTAAFVVTLGDSVVDAFYLTDSQGAKLTEPLAIDQLRATLTARLAADALA